MYFCHIKKCIVIKNQETDVLNEREKKVSLIIFMIWLKVTEQMRSSSTPFMYKQNKIIKNLQWMVAKSSSIILNYSIVIICQVNDTGKNDV